MTARVGVATVAEFLANHTALATSDPGLADSLARRLLDEFYMADGAPEAPPSVFVSVEFDDAEAASAARVHAVEVFTQCSAPVDNPEVAVYQCEVNGPGRLLYPPADLDGYAAEAWGRGQEALG